MMRLRLAATITTVALCAGASAQALGICVEGAYPPFSEISPSGEVIGFDIDIARALCEEMGEDCELVQVGWDGIIPALLEGKCDAIVASMSITEERRQIIDFSDKYLDTPEHFVAAVESGLDPTPEGMAGKVVGVQRGTIHHDFMEGEFPATTLKLYASQDEALLDLVSGRIDAIMADGVAISEGFLKTRHGERYTLLGQGFSVPEYHGTGAGIGVRKEDTELRDRFSAAIRAIRAQGTYDEIAAEYFDFDVYGAPPVGTSGAEEVPVAESGARP